MAINIIIVCYTVYNNDAIGNDALKQYFCLKSNNFNVYLYAEHVDTKYHYLLLNKYRLYKLIKYGHNLMIYHHSTYWQSGEELINEAACRVFLKYHNITPSSFFEEYRCELFNSTRLAREQTERLVGSGKISRYLADSTFNGEELLRYGADSSQIFILPPFHRVEEFASVEVNPRIVEKSGGMVNVLFVGRIAPNKGYEHLIEVIRVYRELYDNNIKLNLVGGLDPSLDAYYEKLNSLIDKYGLDGHIYFQSKVSFEELKRYYQASDVFLLMSEHEGFCVPILESQYNNLPIVALGKCAVKETLGVGQILFDDLDYVQFAAAVRLIATNKVYRNVLIKAGVDNYLKYTADKLCSKLLFSITT